MVLVHIPTQTFTQQPKDFRLRCWNSAAITGSPVLHRLSLGPLLGAAASVALETDVGFASADVNRMEHRLVTFVGDS